MTKMLATICNDYNEKSEGVRTIIRRIVKLLESSKPSTDIQPKSSPVSISIERSPSDKEKTGNGSHVFKHVNSSKYGFVVIRRVVHLIF